MMGKALDHGQRRDRQTSPCRLKLHEASSGKPGAP
jgi:hypothetical protein